MARPSLSGESRTSPARRQRRCLSAVYMHVCRHIQAGGQASPHTRAAGLPTRPPHPPRRTRHGITWHGTARHGKRHGKRHGMRRGAAWHGTARYAARHGTAHRLCASCLTVPKCNTGNWTLVPSSHCSTPRCQHYTVHIRVYRHAPRHEYRQVHRHAVSTQRG